MTKLVKIEGIGETYAAKLEAAGVQSLEALLETGSTKKGRKSLEEASGLSGKLILRWVNMADLFRVKGIGEEYADLLEAAGVDTVPELAQRNAENLHAKMLEVNETKKLVTARHRPIIVITSNNEKELPDAFLRRCFFHYIKFPDQETMAEIVDVHFPDLKKDLLREALDAFYKVRDVRGLKKKPSTSELLDWIKLLLAEDIPPEVLKGGDSRKAIPPLYGALLKNEQDVLLFEQLVFLDRRTNPQ